MNRSEEIGRRIRAARESKRRCVEQGWTDENVAALESAVQHLGRLTGLAWARKVVL